MWELDHKQGWVPKNLYSWIIKLEKTLESPLNFKKIKPVYSKENQLWIVIGKTVTKAEVPVLWPPDAKNRLIEKYPDAGKNWRQEERGTIEDEMVGWHHQFNGYEFEQIRKQWKTGKPGVPQFMALQSSKKFSNWTTSVQCVNIKLARKYWAHHWAVKMNTK